MENFYKLYEELSDMQEGLADTLAILDTKKVLYTLGAGKTAEEVEKELEKQEKEEARRTREGKSQPADHRRRRGCCPEVQPGDQRQGIRNAAWPLGLRQINHSAFDRRL